MARSSRLIAPTIFSPSFSMKNRWIGSPYPVHAGISAIRDVYATPKLLKNTTDARVLPACSSKTALEQSEGARRNGARPSGRASDAVGGPRGRSPPDQR
jgi:hypothetical protein